MVSILFLVISIIVFNAVAILIPKRITRLEIYTTGLFVLVIGLFADIYLGLKLNLYDFFSEGLGYDYLIISLGTYPSSNIIYLNYFPFEKGIIKKILYITVWTIFHIVYEWCTIRAGILYHDEWTLLYSAIIYPVTFFIIVLNLKLIRYLKTKG